MNEISCFAYSIEENSIQLGSVALLYHSLRSRAADALLEQALRRWSYLCKLQGQIGRLSGGVSPSLDMLSIFRVLTLSDRLIAQGSSPNTEAIATETADSENG